MQTYTSRMIKMITMLAMVLLLGVTGGQTVLAAETQSFNIEKGSVKITEPGKYYVYGKKNVTTNTITINTDGKVELTIKNINIENDDAITIENGTVKLILQGKNRLEADYGNGIDGGENKLTIEGTGSLVAIADIRGCGISAQEIIINDGTIEASGASYGYAAIGTGQGLELKSITINGGNIKARADIGETYGTGKQVASAGIGSGSEKCGTITINGGKIESYCGLGPAIGGDKAIKSIKITGGDIIAVGGDLSAGIGCGGVYGASIDACSKIDSITITGGNIKATGAGYGNKWQGAGIGGGRYAEVGTIYIKGGKIEAYGSENGAGIGTGMNGTCEKIKITGGTISATAGFCSAAIGLGGRDTVSDGYENDAVLKQLLIQGGNIKVTAEAARSVGIGADVGCEGELRTLKISGGTITCKSSGGNNDIACDGGEKITITGGSIDAKRIKHPVVNSKGKTLKKYSIFVGKKKKNATVSEIDYKGYGVKDVVVNKNGYVKVYLPNNQTPEVCVDKKWYAVGEIPISETKVKLSTTSYNYNGKAKKPSVKVTFDGKTLKKDTDYTVSYKNNKNIGKATVTIKGKGKYTGKVTANFTIKAKKGTVITTSNSKYKITSSTENTMALLSVTNKEKTSITVPATKTYGGVEFKVTEISENAFKNNKKLAKVVVGKNVTTIGKSAFNGCSKLKTIEIKSTKLKKVGASAFKGINAKATIKVPKSKFTDYQNLLKGKGQGSKVKIAKIK